VNSDAVGQAGGGALLADVGEIRSPFLRKMMERRGIQDDCVASLMIVDRYRRRPEPSNAVVALMLASIHKELPLEAAIVSREAELGRSLTEQEIENEIDRLKGGPGGPTPD
jgi:hypothetical protein